MANCICISSRLVGCSLFNQLRIKIKSSTPATVRWLYSKTALGIDRHLEQHEKTKAQMCNIADKFREKMITYSDENSTNMIFTEDLKNMIYLSDNDDDINTIIKMMKKFNKQNKNLRFASFIFGPVVMRLFYLHNKVDLALESFKSPEFEGFFDQLITYQLLMDFLYENQKYDDILDVFHIIFDRQIESIKYPKNIIVLTIAACYKMNNEKSWTFASKLWEDLIKAGHLPMRRATTFMAGLALNQNQPSAAIEILNSARNQNYTTVRNLKVSALIDIGRIDDALVTLKSVLYQDNPGLTKHTFNKDIIEKLHKSVEKLNNPDIVLEFTRINELFKKQGMISDITLDEQLCCEITPPPMLNNRQYNPMSRFGLDSNPNRRDRMYTKNNFIRRQGLTDLV